VTQLRLEQAASKSRRRTAVSAALALLPRFRPELVITDLRMPGISGLDLLKSNKAQAPEV